MCIVATSESGHGGRFEPCDSYIKLLSEKSRLEGRCAGLELGNKINLESIKRQDERMVELLKENEALREQLSVARNFAKRAGDRCEVLRQENVEYDRINSEQAQEVGRLKQDRDRLAGILDKSRAVSASWEQYKAAGALDCDAKDAVAPALECGLNRLVDAVDKYDLEVRHAE